MSSGGRDPKHKGLDSSRPASGASGAVPSGDAGYALRRERHSNALETLAGLRADNAALRPLAPPVPTPEGDGSETTRFAVHNVTDVASYLGTSLAAELAAWGELVESGRVRTSVGERWHALYAVGFLDAVRALGLDGAWPTIFCGCSLLYEDRATRTYAEWQTDNASFGTSRIFQLPRLGDALEPSPLSLTAWFARRFVGERAIEASHLVGDVAPSLPPHGSDPAPVQKWSRSKWLRDLLRAQTTIAPTSEALEAERARDATHLSDPSVIAYWLLTEAVLDNKPRLEDLLRLPLPPFAPLAELAEVAERVLRDVSVPVIWWPTTEIARLRALRVGHSK